MKNTLFVLVTILSTTVFAAEFKVGVVDMQKAIQTSSAGKKAKKEVEGDFEKKKYSWMCSIFENGFLIGFHFCTLIELIRTRRALMVTKFAWVAR